MSQSTTLSKNHSTDVHKTAKRPDRFLSAGKSLMDAAAKQGKLIAVLGVLALVAAAGTGAWFSRQDSREAAARDALYGAQKTLDEELKLVAKDLAPTPPTPKLAKGQKAPPAPPAPGPEAIVFKAFDVNARLPKGLAAMKEVAEKHKGTRGGFEAAMGVGDLYLNHGPRAEAEAWFKRGADMAGSRLEKSFAWYSLGASYEATGKPNEAVDAYQRAVSAGEPSTEGEVLSALARAQELAGKTNEAKGTYDRIIKDLANSDYARAAESAKAALQ